MINPTVDAPIGVVGPGYIGHLFAQQFALAEYEVRAWSPSTSAHSLRDRLHQSMSRLADIGAIERASITPAIERVSVHDDLASAIAPCGAVMESIVEDAEAKAALYERIEAAIDAEALLWSATSNFPMTRLAGRMVHPERAIVMHPVQTQQIIFVEVVPGQKTSEPTTETTLRFCEEVRLRAVLVRQEIPGFLWNRVWFAMLREMLHLVDVGAAEPADLDTMVQTTLQAFIPAFGPFQMTDLIGHDTLRDISNALYPELANDRTASRTTERLVTEGRLGVKSGQGFYRDDEARVAAFTEKLDRIAEQLQRDTP